MPQDWSCPGPGHCRKQEGGQWSDQETSGPELLQPASAMGATGDLVPSVSTGQPKEHVWVFFLERRTKGPEKRG